MKKNLYNKAKSVIVAHKVISIIILIIIVVGGYYWYKSATAASAVPQYSLSRVRNGNIMQTVSGTGQVSASNQTDIQSQVSGTIQSINVSVGQVVHAGDLIATIDSSNALISLNNARISLAKLTEPAKQADISNAQNTLNKSYTDAFNAASTIYLDLPSIMTGIKNILYSQSGFLSDQNASFLTPSAQAMRITAGTEYDAAVTQYQNSLNEFRSLTRTSATSSLNTAFANTYLTIQMVARAVTDTQNTITYIMTTQPDYQAKLASSAASSVNTLANQSNSDLSNLASAQNSVTSATNSFTTLISGADQYDIQSSQLNLQQQQKNYSNYFIRAPYDGIVGRIPVNVYGQAGNGTVIATIVGTQMTASISLDEVTTAKVRVGQPANITFNAINGFNATGTVSSVDQIGTVTQGVVSYGVKIIIGTQDDRIKPGMSVNTSIVTFEKDGVLLVPNTAIKMQSGKSYVQIFDQSVIAPLTPGINTASTTRPLGGQGANSSSRTTTITTNSLPTQVTIVTGDSDDSNTEIVSGLTQGQLVVTKTIAGGSASAAAATPTLFSSMTGNRAGGGAVH